MLRKISFDGIIPTFVILSVPSQNSETNHFSYWKYELSYVQIWRFHV